MTNMGWALSYARANIPVFPVGTNKAPLTPHGLKDATTDEATIQAWWSSWPDAGIAAVLGPGRGIVLDVDPRHGGNESLAALVVDHGPLPEGPRARTGGGGAHYWFAWPGGEVPIRHGFRPGLDLQSENSYVILPPSPHASGRTYEWEHPLIGVRLPLPPPWLLAAAEEGVTPGGRRTFEATPSGQIPHGQHHDFIVSTAASLASRVQGISEADLLRSVRATVREVIDDADVHEQEIAIAVRSALMKYGRERLPEQAPAPTALPIPSQVAATGPFPTDLFYPTKQGLQPSLTAFVEWFRRTEYFVIPIERGTFSTPSNFELLRYQDGYYNGMAKAHLIGRTDDAFRYVRIGVENAYREVGLTSRAAFREEVVKGIGATSGFHRSRADFNPPDLLCLKNGILDTRTGVRSDHSPDTVFTWRMPVEYVPGALCPEFERFLERVMPDAKRRDLIVDLMGYCLWRRNPYQIFVVNVGDGSNGKTTWLRVVEEMLGTDAIAAETLQSLSSQRFAPAELEGKLANLCDDLPFDKPLAATGVLKMLTGEGELSAERKFAPKFKFRFEGKLIANANRTPEVRDDTYAFWRRLVVIPWEVTVTEAERDPLLISKLRAEMSGILNLALRGLERVRGRVERREEFDPDGVFDGSKEEWHSRSDPVRAELLDDFREDLTGFVPNSDLYSWHVQRSEQGDREPLSQRAFGIRVTRTFPKSQPSRQQRSGRSLWGRSGISRSGPSPVLDEAAAGRAQKRLDEAIGGQEMVSTPATAVSRQSDTPTSPVLASVVPQTTKPQVNESGDGYNIPGNTGDAPPSGGTETNVSPSNLGLSSVTSESGPSVAEIDAAAGALMDAIRRRGDVPFEVGEMVPWVAKTGHTILALSAAFGRVCGMDVLRRLSDGRWQLKGPGENVAPSLGSEEAEMEPPSDERPLGRTHFSCSYCVTAPPKEHDCGKCEKCRSQERQRERRIAREAHGAADGPESNSG